MESSESWLTIYTKKNENFGRVSTLVPNFYADNSFSKQFRLEKSEKRRLDWNVSSFQDHKEKVHTIKRQREIVRYNEKRIQELLVQVHLKQGETELMEASALKIQRVIRGYLTRKHLDEIVIDFRKKNMRNCLIRLSKYDLKLIYHVGLTPEKAAIKIQRQAKLFLFRNMIKRLQHVYYTQLNEKMFYVFELLSRAFYRFKAVQKKNWKVLKTYRAHKLEEIKRRIAVLQIKKHWKSLRLSYRIMLHKIKRYNRIIKYHENSKIIDGFKESSPDFKSNHSEFTSFEFKSISSDPKANTSDSKTAQTEEKSNPKDNNNSHSGTDNDVLFEIEEYSVPDNNNTPNTRQKFQRFKLGLISYNIPKAKRIDVLPFLYEKDLSNSQHPNHFSVTRALASRMSAANPSRKPVKIMNPEHPLSLIIPQKKVEIKRRSRFPLYMKETANSLMNKRDVLAINDVSVPSSPKSIEVRVDSTVMKPTFSHISKIKEPKSFSAPRKPIWKPAYTCTKRLSISDKIEDKIQNIKVPLTRPHRVGRLEEKSIDYYEPLPSSLEMIKPFSLDFQSALPEINDIVSKYALRVHVKPRINTMRSYLKTARI